MIKYKRIKTGKRYIEAVCIRLLSKNFILLKGRKGYIMCGYLDLKAARKFKDAAIKVVGVSSIEDALNTAVHSCTPQARKLGIYKGQAIKDVLKIIA